MRRSLVVAVVAVLAGGGCCCRNTHEVRSPSASAASALGPPPTETPVRPAAPSDPVLVALSAGSDEQAAEAAEQVRPEMASPALVEALATRLETGGDASATYATALVRLGCRSVPALMRVTGSDKPEAQKWAIEALGDLGARASDAVPALTQTLLSPNKEVVQGAIRTLIAIGAPSVSAQAELMRLAQRTTGDEHRDSVVAVAHLSHYACPENVAQFLVRALASDEDAAVRAGVATAGRGMHRHVAMLVPGLRRAVRDPDDSVRVEAALSLCALGLESAEATAVIAGINVDTSPPKFAMRVADALRPSKGAAQAVAVRAYARAATAPAPDDRVHVVDAVLSLAAADPTRVRAILKSLEADADPGVREAVAAALSSLE